MRWSQIRQPDGKKLFFQPRAVLYHHSKTVRTVIGRPTVILYLPTDALPVTLCGQELWPLPSWALMWPGLRLLAVAGPRIYQTPRREKNRAYGSASTDLQRLSQLVENLHLQRLVVLGVVLEGSGQNRMSRDSPQLISRFRKAFSGQLDVIREGVREDVPTTDHPGDARNLTSSTRELTVGPFCFQNRCWQEAEDLAREPLFTIAAQRATSHPAVSHTTGPHHFCLQDDRLLVAPFSTTVPGPDYGGCSGHRAAIVDRSIRWQP